MFRASLIPATILCKVKGIQLYQVASGNQTDNPSGSDRLSVYIISISLLVFNEHIKWDSFRMWFRYESTSSVHLYSSCRTAFCSVRNLLTAIVTHRNRFRYSTKCPQHRNGSESPSRLRRVSLFCLYSFRNFSDSFLHVGEGSGI